MKKDRLIITVSDVNTSKSYNINKVLKKILLWALLITLLIVSLSFFIITKLVGEVDKLSYDRDLLTKENYRYNQEIEEKKAKIEELGEKLEDIEDIIGINNDEETNLIQRATLARLTSAQKAYMLQTIPSACPLKKCYVTSPFGWRTHPITKKRDYHKGTDLRAKRRTPVHATADGVVRYVQDKNEGTFGRVIIISHNFGFESIYGHLRFTDVKVGDVVKQGQQIGRSGNSGRSNGPHLHYEVRYASRLLNPENFINWNMKNYEKIFEKQRRVEWESLVNLISSQNHRLAQQ
jgi:murein DD-endopeptidase MepM/ murein hydrolase activator NlpD